MSLFTRRDDLLLTQILKERGRLHDWEIEFLDTLNGLRRIDLEFDMSPVKRQAFNQIARKLELLPTVHIPAKSLGD